MFYVNSVVSSFVMLKKMASLIEGFFFFFFSFLNLYKSKCTYTLVLWSSFLPLGIFLLVAHVGFVGKKRGTLMHLTDDSAWPSALPVEGMVMSVIGRKQSKPAGHTLPFALVCCSVCSWNAVPPHPQAFNSGTKWLANLKKMQMLEIQKNKINKSQDKDPPTQHTFQKSFLSQYQVGEEEKLGGGLHHPRPRPPPGPMLRCRTLG